MHGDVVVIPINDHIARNRHCLSAPISWSLDYRRPAATLEAKLLKTESTYRVVNVLNRLGIVLMVHTNERLRVKRPRPKVQLFAR